ncbi:hypothetical protein C8F04DRAFT_598695 [Mycena alexandri]|uniref:Uncharacterized protein n=1 Tax=Mycena alexandri TaxID=1745969 RepID=A0AAD6TES4_9AGAR|nr:hypothetical protein C8F04DRAFT_598695 [Mycena alexandri]
MASPLEKRPRKCRKCQMPMKGHRAENCIADQETASLATPPSTPPNATTSKRNRTTNHIEIGVGGHWRDPSWTPHVIIPAIPSNSHSLIPTVLVDEDGNTILGSHDVAPEASDAGDAHSLHLDTATSRPKTPMAQVMDQAHALQLCDPVVSIVKVNVVDLPRMQATAGQSGLCTSIVRTPWTAPRFKDEFEPSLKNYWEQDEKSVWVVVGGDSALVQRTADLQQQYEQVPGAIKDDLVVVQATYKHIFIASTISALVVVGAVSLFL